MPLQQSKLGGSGAFLGRASDDEEYWIKVLQGPQGDRVPITEQIVGRVGKLIGAPTCAVQTIYIPKAVSGWEYRDGRTLEAGCGHASLEVSGAVEEEKGNLKHRNRDANASRHAGYFALFDWCWGDDAQGLLALTRDHEFYSHDHGHFLPPGGGRWTVAALEERLEEPHEFPDDGGGLDMLAVNELVNRLEGLERGELAFALSAIPRAWPVTTDELESVGFFLEVRAPRVAERLKTRFGGGST